MATAKKSVARARCRPVPGQIVGILLGGAIGLPPGASTTSAKINNKFGPLLNVGVNYAFTKNLGMTFSVSYIPMKTTATMTTRVNGNAVAVSKAKLTLDPIVPFLYLTYKF